MTYPSLTNEKKQMKKSITISLIIILTTGIMPSCFAHGFWSNLGNALLGAAVATSDSALSKQTETVIGSVFLRVDAGESYELYESSADSFRQYLSGWKHQGWRDKTVSYSYDELYAKLKKEALRKYGSSYPDLKLKDFNYEMKYTEPGELPDTKSHSQVVGSSTEYKKKDRIAKYYNCSATVVVSRE